MKTRRQKSEWVLELLTEADVPIFTALGDGYISYVSKLDICNDGSGPASFKPHLNSEVEPFIVVPSGIIPALGCLCRVTNLETGEFKLGVAGKFGPHDDTGEVAYCLAKEINPEVTHGIGDTRRIYLYELWPDIAAPEYELQPC